MGFDYAGKVRALLAKADSADKLGNEEEAQSYRNKAFSIMREYQIAEEDALAVDATVAVPTSVVIDLTESGAFSEHRYHMLDMLRHICQHTGIRCHTAWLARGMRITLVGYEGDLRYAEFLWTSAHLMFVTRITPQWQDDSTEAENIFFFRNAGKGRKEIADRAWGRGEGDLAKNRSKVQRIYLAEAKRRGEDARATGLGFNGREYADAYAESFVLMLGRRLREARDAADSTGGGLVLAGRAERVKEAFNAMFPPPPPAADVKPYVAPNADCVPCSKAKT